MKSRTGKLKTIVFSLIVFLFFYGLFAVCQIVRVQKYLRPTSQGVIKNTHVRDSVLGWKLKPNAKGEHFLKNNFHVHYTINERGERKTGTFDESLNTIFIFGDSFTFGHGVGDTSTFSYLLWKETRGRFNVVNLGVMGYGIIHMYEKFLKMEADIQRGDIVLFTPLSSNIRRNVNDFIVPFNSFRSIGNLSFEFYPVYKDGAVQGHEMKDHLLNRIKYSLLTANGLRRIFKPVYHLFIPDAKKEAIVLISKVRSKVEKKGGVFILSFLPTPAELVKGDYQEDISSFEYDDMMGFFPKNPREVEKIRFRDDGHWNEKGHQIAARAILKIIKDKYN